jgi:hypothetical protein
VAPPVLGWLVDLVEGPIFQKLIVPILGNAIARFFERQAAKLELKSAVKSAKAASTADQLREASKRLTDASNRP